MTVVEITVCMAQEYSPAQTAHPLHARGRGHPRHIGMIAAILCAIGLTTGCAVGPNYRRPAAEVPGTWKGQGPWQTAAPKDAIPKGNWWELYHDAELNNLEQDLLQANQSLKAAQDRLFQARALARVASAGFFPTVTADPNGQRQRLSGNRPLSGASSSPTTPTTQNNFVVPFDVSYEVDLFGSVRRNLEAANASLQATRCRSWKRSPGPERGACRRLLQSA